MKLLLFIPQLLLGLGFAPGFFWLWFFYRRDRWEPEPKAAVLKTFLFGMLAVIPVAVVEIPFAMLKLRYGLAAIGFLAVGVIEEYAKYFVVRFGIYNRRDFNEPMDGIVYAAAAALGFASLENVLYLFGALNRDVVFFAVLFLGRSFLSTFGHALFSSIWGDALGRAKFDPAQRRRLVSRGVLIAALVHGLFNGILVWGHGLGLLGAALLITVLWFFIRRRIRVAEALSPFRLPVIK